MARRRETQGEFEEFSSYSSHREYRKHRKTGGRLKKALLAFGAAVCVLLMAAGGVMMYISTTYLSDLSTTNITKDPEDLGINEMAVDLVQDDSVKNIALFGLDARSDTFEGQADVTMILTVDNKHNKIKMTSIMRDSEVRIEGQGYDDYIDWNYKINAAYALGGPELAIRTLNANFNLDITDYVTMNFAKLAQLIDAFGGVDMALSEGEILEVNRNLDALRMDIYHATHDDTEEGTSEDTAYAVITDDDYIPDIYGELDLESSDYYQAGTYHLNGNQAVAYGRIREIGSDFERVQRQQKVLRQLMGKVTDISLSEYPGIIRKLLPLCETSLELQDVIAMTPIVAAGFTVESISVPDFDYELDLHDDLSNYNLVYDVEQASHRISSFIYEENSPYWDEYGYDTGASAAQ